jgi:exodeoxyribonuclease VII small subunit
MGRTRTAPKPSPELGADAKGAQHDASTYGPAAAEGEAGSVGEGAEEPSFETSAERLAAIVEQLESGELPLESSLKLFEEGVRVARAAQRRLDQAERRVDELLGVDERGEAITRELER